MTPFSAQPANIVPIEFVQKQTVDRGMEGLHARVIADSVGLGKTIEAWLILREMLMRQKVRRTVICCPPSVVRQWKDEMEQRFGLTFMIYDRDYVTAKRQERGYGVNPWTTHSRFIISQSLIRNETYAGPLRDWLGEFQGGSMFILDEAHNAAPASATKYAIDSKLTRAIRDLTPRFEHKLFLSATPHNGHSNSFSAILEMLDPQKFCRGVPVHHASRDAVMIRRLKHDLREIGEEFPERKIIRIDIEGLPEDAPELVLSHLLQRYRLARETRLDDATKGQRASASHRTTPKRCAGTDWQPNRGTPTRSTASATRTAPAKACRRTTCRRTCGTTSRRHG